MPKAFGCGDDRFFVRETFAFSVKEYLKFVLEEHASKAIVSSEAVPMLFVKFSTLINFLRHSIRRSSRLSLVNDFILVRDAVFFVFDFFCWEPFFRSGSCWEPFFRSGSSFRVSGVHQS